MEKRQRQKQETRQLLTEAACRVFAKKGIVSARMSDIAQAAGVSHGTVFLHFETQEALVTQVTAQVCGAIAARTHALSEGCGTLRGLLEAHLRGIAEFEPFYTRLVIENRLLPQGARDAWLAVQSAVSLHFSRVAAAESACAGKDTALLFNTWVGLVHHYLANGDLFAPAGGVIRRYGTTLADFYMALAVPQTETLSRQGAGE